MQDNNSGMKRMICLSKPVTLKVKALPPPPAHVEGKVVVGLPKLQLQASPTSLKVGEPLSITIQVDHDIHETFEFPMLSSMGAFDRNFKIPDDRAPATYKNAKRKISSPNPVAKASQFKHGPSNRLDLF